MLCTLQNRLMRERERKRENGKGRGRSVTIIVSTLTLVCVVCQNRTRCWVSLSCLQSILFAEQNRSTMNNDDTKEMIMLLPSTVLLKIFYYIDNVADLSRLKCVCQRFWSLIERYSQQLIRIDIYDIKCSQMTINTDDNKHSQYCRITFEIASTKKLNDINGHDLGKFLLNLKNNTDFSRSQ
jgi:hypothetical protein